MLLKEPIRVLHVLNRLDRGGAESMLMNYYRNIDRNKVQFDFVVHGDDAGAYADEVLALGGRIFHVPKLYGHNIFSYILAWKKLLKNHQEIRIVHGHMPSTAFIYLFLAKIYGKYVVDHSHSVEHDRTERKIIHKLRYCIYWGTRLIPNRFFACSIEAGIDKYGIGIVNSPRFAIWHNAINIKRFKYDNKNRDNVRNQLSIPLDAKVIGHVGRFIDVKNHVFIIHMFSSYKKQNKDSILLLVGDGELREKVELEAKEYSVWDSIRFAGNVSNVEDYMSAMDVFILPSKYEGLPLVTIEAQANGLPCIVSDVVTQSVVVTAPPLVTFLPITDELLWCKKLDELFLDIDYRRDKDVKIQSEYCIGRAAKRAENEYRNIVKKY